MPILKLLIDPRHFFGQLLCSTDGLVVPAAGDIRGHRHFARRSAPADSLIFPSHFLRSPLLEEQERANAARLNTLNPKRR